MVQVPYGTSFHSSVQWACQHAGRGKCKLRVSGQVEFTKSCFVKGLVTKATQEVRACVQTGRVHEAVAQLHTIRTAVSTSYLIQASLQERPCLYAVLMRLLPHLSKLLQACLLLCKSAC